MTETLPSAEQAKAEAKELRAALAKNGTEIGHSAALELVAQRYGFKDWNGLSAAISRQAPDRWAVGMRVSGRYLSQAFEATVLQAERLRPGWFELVLDFDEAVDVVRFDGMSNMRKRLRVAVGPKGASAERTSDGKPHVQLDMASGIGAQ